MSYRPLSVLILAASLFSAGCCNQQLWRRVQPKRPQMPTGWRERPEPSWNGLLMGPFLLEQGQSVENQRIGVRVVNVNPATCRSVFAEYPDRAEAVLEFYEPSNGKPLCQATVSENSNVGIDRPEICGGKIRINTVGVLDINSDEKWVIFDLRQRD